MTALLNNHLLFNALISWAVAQVLKTIIYALVNKRIDFKRLMGDGGMPSGHSATVTALAVTTAIEYGFDSPIFAVTTVLAVIVMHDAMGVRREAGKHAELLNEIVKIMDDKLDAEVKMKVFLGHTPTQVVMGALLGFIVSMILR